VISRLGSAERIIEGTLDMRLIAVDAKSRTGAPNEAHVRARMDESARVGDRALFDQEGPELARQVEFGVDLKRPGDIDTAVLA
jgi:hypothetical protein